MNWLPGRRRRRRPTQLPRRNFCSSSDSGVVVGRGTSLRGRAMANRAEQAAVPAGGGKYRIDQEAGRGLAVGAGDGDRAADAPAGRPKKFAAITASALRASSTRTQLTSGIAGGGGSSLTIAMAPRGDGVGSVMIAVGGFATNGNKERTRDGFAAVVNRPRRLSKSARDGEAHHSCPDQ